MSPRGVDNEAPYFVDMVGQQMAEKFPGLTAQANAVDVHTTLDINLQRLALDAVRDGLARVDELLARRKRKGRAQAALLAVDPRTGEILAMVGGRSYNQSQYNRAIVARRQPGSVFKPFVYLAAFERGGRRRAHRPHAGVADQRRARDLHVRRPDVGAEELRRLRRRDHVARALAMSRNLGTIHVGETVGFDKVAEVWKRVGVGTPPKAYPVDHARRVRADAARGGAGVHAVHQRRRGAAAQGHRRDRRRRARTCGRSPPLRTVARPDTTFLVTNMMRSVLNEGTGAGARAAGFTLDAAGKSGTTNDLRDAWFVGFTPELLTVVWVGFDDNQPVSLSGSQAALPIWTQFMKSATAGQATLSSRCRKGSRSLKSIATPVSWRCPGARGR